jgi:acetyl-CoA decarbonylase/synthase complex subunit gamma
MLLKALPDTAELQARLAQPFVEGRVATRQGPVPRISTRTSLGDRLGALRMRLGLGRSTYRVLPGIYAAGSPTKSSPVLVSANYKLSFDALKQALAGLHVWILVLDTRGINVWCAAGKGSFGNAELARRIAATKLGLIVDHRELILPQLSGPGVSAHSFAKEQGWRLRFGPVRAADIPAYLAADREKTAAMSRVDFPPRDRLALAPLELIAGLKKLAPYLVLLIASAFLSSAGDPLAALLRGGATFLPFALSYAAAALLFPLLLPLLPGKAFSLKGAFLGLLLAGLWILAARPVPLLALSYLLAIPALAAWFGLLFTGSSTFTSLSGVELEVARARPPIALAAIGGLGLRLLLLAGLI